jgi:predicted ribosomally synthesized peptide with SipW-like signal peptide
MAVCGTLIAGSTYALFTSSSQVNVALTSGHVAVTATVGNVVTYSVTPNDSGEIVDEFGAKYSYAKTEDGVFKNKGTAVLKDDTLTITNMTPGDEVTFDISILNNSNVDIMYRVGFLSNGVTDGSNTLMNDLNVTLTDLPDSGSDEADASISNMDYNGYVKYISQWVNWSVDDEVKSGIAHATIELPITSTNDNTDKSIDIVISLEAIQGNANVGANTTPTMTTAPVVLKGLDDEALVGKNTTISIALPDGTIVSPDGKPAVTVTKADLNKDIELATADSAVTLNFDATNFTLPENNGKYAEIIIENIESDVTNVYHDNIMLAASADEDTDGRGYFTYDEATKKLTIFTKSLSPFTIEYKYSGGTGEEDNPYLIGTEDEFYEVLRSGQTNNNLYIKLLKDLKTNRLPYAYENESITIDMNGCSLTSSQSQSSPIFENGSIKAYNGSIIAMGFNYSNSDPAFIINEGGLIELTNVYLRTSATALYPKGNNATVKIVDSNVLCDANLCIGTNANDEDNYNVKIILKNSVLRNIGTTCVMLNVPGSLTIEDCTLSGAMQALIVRGGTAEVKNSTLQTYYDTKDLNTYIAANSFSYDTAYTYYNEKVTDNSSWSSSYGVFRAPVVLGDKDGSSYDYPTNVTLENVVIKSIVNVYEGDEVTVYEGDTSLCKTAIYAVGKETNRVMLTLNGTNEIVGDIVIRNDYVTFTSEEPIEVAEAMTVATKKED